MGDGVVGSLRVVLGADVASFEDGMKKAGKNLSLFGIETTKAAAIISGSLTAAFGTLITGVTMALAQADKIGKMAESVGVPVEEFSKLKYAADLSGVSMESLGATLGILNKNLAAAAINANSNAGRAFAALGISAKDTDGNLKSASQAVQEIAGKFAQYKDGASKSALATDLFGRSGAALIPMLNQGSAGLKRMFDEAESLGLVLDEKTKTAASEFSDTVIKLEKVAGSLFVRVSAELAPALKSLAEVLLGVAKNQDFAKTAADSIVSAFQRVLIVTLGVIETFDRLGAEWTAFSNLMNAMSFSDISKYWAEFNAEGKKTQEIFDGLSDKVKSWFQITVNAIPKANFAPIKEGAESATNAVLSFIDSQDKAAAKLKAQGDTLRMTTSQQEQYRIGLEAVAIATSKGIPLTDELKQKIADSAASYGAIAEAAKKAQGQFQALQQIGQDVGGAISSTFSDAIKNGGKFLDVLKSLASKLLDIAFQATVTKPLGNFLGNMFSGGKSPISPLFGFASGGSFNVGGSGGIDSQMVAFKASPNENVTVSKPGQGSSDGSTPVILNNSYTFAPGMTGNDMATMKALVQQSQTQTLQMLRRMNQSNSGWQFA